MLADIDFQDLGDVRVELWGASIARYARFPVHCWLLIYRGDQIDRWEVWQYEDCCDESWGHVHKNLFLPYEDVGGGASRLIASWQGGAAQRIAQRAEKSPDSYPCSSHYRVFPGPNSNTYIQWILDDEYTLGWRAVGSGFVDQITRHEREVTT
ncbi:DUF3750 domain-containing protein [Neorhodopirellula pilleata]|uniref:Uncharacterized protein n=1 Tax=Neorhodopirellula pilleata TaxID=2714738 RepID=A0A5C5ZG54_9BACT|nr:DUF3750 domain-containing protein [Neorhodopirellula pilleata]TWT86037.1 hypothetical protein Pla100_62650 [Neorhodopirellula pilleata]